MTPPFVRLSCEALLALVTLAQPAFPQSVPLDQSRASAAATPAPDKQPATLEQTFDNLGLLYADKGNPVLQELWFLGRYHGQAHWSNANDGRTESRWEDRRFRIGAQAKLFEKLTLHAQMVSGSNFQPFYAGFTELWAQWSFHEAFNLTVGQQKNRFTHDRNASSRYLNYMERAMLTNMFNVEYTPAVTLSGRSGKVNYYTGIFSNATGTDMGQAFTELNSGFSYIALVTYDLHEAVPTSSAFLSMSYLHSDARANATNMNRFADGVSAAVIVTQGPASLVTELTAGTGGPGGNARGLNLQPSFFLTDQLQLVGRYQVASADQPAGLRAQRRYERNVGLTTGDHYQAAYGGLTYYIAGQRLKLMTGAEYAELGGKSEWTGMASVRLYWGPHSNGPFPMGKTLHGAW